MYPKNKPLPPESASRAANAVHRSCGAKQENVLASSLNTSAAKPEVVEEMNNKSNSSSSPKQNMSVHLQVPCMEASLVHDGGYVSDKVLTAGPSLRAKANQSGPLQSPNHQFPLSAVPPPPYDEHSNSNMCSMAPPPSHPPPPPPSPSRHTLPMPTNMLMQQPCTEAPYYEAAVWNMHQRYPVANPSPIASPQFPPPPPPPPSWRTHERAPPGMPMDPHDMSGVMQVPSIPPPPLKVPPPYNDGNGYSGGRQGMFASGNAKTPSGGSASFGRRSRVNVKNKNVKETAGETTLSTPKQLNDSALSFGHKSEKSEENDKAIESHHFREISAVSSGSLQHLLEEQSQTISYWREKARQMSHHHRQNVSFLLQLVASLLERITFLKQSSVDDSPKDSCDTNGTERYTPQEDNPATLNEQLRELQNVLDCMNDDAELTSGKRSDDTVESRDFKTERNHRRRLITDILSLPQLMPFLEAATANGDNGAAPTADECAREDRTASRLVAAEVRALMKAVDFETTRPLSLSVVVPQPATLNGSASLE